MGWGCEFEQAASESQYKSSRHQGSFGEVINLSNANHFLTVKNRNFHNQPKLQVTKCQGNQQHPRRLLLFNQTKVLISSLILQAGG